MNREITETAEWPIDHADDVLSIYSTCALWRFEHDPSDGDQHAAYGATFISLPRDGTEDFDRATLVQLIGEKAVQRAEEYAADEWAGAMGYTARAVA